MAQLVLLHLGLKGGHFGLQQLHFQGIWCAGLFDVRNPYWHCGTNRRLAQLRELGLGSVVLLLLHDDELIALVGSGSACSCSGPDKQAW